MSATPPPPVAPKHPKRIEQLGRVRVDDYAWMKDDNWQALLRDPSQVRPDIKAHLSSQSQAEGGGPNVMDYLSRHPDVRQHLIDLSQQCTD